MATVTAGSLALASRLSRSTSAFKPFLSSVNNMVVSPSFYRKFGAKLRASSSTARVEATPGADLNENEAKKKTLACPICYDPLIWNGDPVFSVDSTPRSILKCSICKKVYSGNENHLDLTVTSGSKKYGEYRPASSELFRLPLVSFLYERGWRQAFSIWGGFPGPEREFELMRDYLKPVIGGTIIDASCGSGMFTRLFAKSGLFSLVVALDFSESMLKQSYDYIKQEENISKELSSDGETVLFRNLILVRADIARLPFASSSIDAVHAGAALHCWPSPSAGVAEISRILRPGGVFVATTYIVDGLYSYIPFLSPIRQVCIHFNTC
ncbi:S-adenosyl-L-methionine-dependent methyltransferases superfamily protein [Artemisia annua]|uniref:S-adenosyl-L-methionine-dependent methyltransferases superfamily protein n=1 Tax=Artemisia annua TaxID=35608 RepID=A0A2U1MGN1_ARTAN|nr:S-adenosyl-L-methionine-dependent methyltransferases superfamily protein [Artemisia annua]